MKNKIGFFVVSVIFLAAYHDAKAMEEEPKKLKKSKEILNQILDDTSPPVSPTNSDKVKKRRNNYGEIKVLAPNMSISTPQLNLSSNLSPRLTSSRGESKSPTRSPRPVHNNLVLLGKDRIPVETVDLGETGEKNFSILEDALKKYNVDVFVLFGEENKLDKDCDLQLAAHLQKCKKVVYLQTIQAFYEAMELWSKKNDDDMEKDKIKVIAVYGASNDKNFYEMLAGWAIPITIKHAINRNDLINVDGNNQSIKYILDNKEQLKTLADYILHLVYKRVLPRADKPYHYLSSDTALYNKCFMYFSRYNKDQGLL